MKTMIEKDKQIVEKDWINLHDSIKPLEKLIGLIKKHKCYIQSIIKREKKLKKYEETKQRQKAYLQRPEIKQRRKEYYKKYYLKNKGKIQKHKRG